MDLEAAKEMISVIRTERERRSERLRDEDPNFAYDQWLFTDEPFINEMCLMVLVALRHQVERSLVSLAARANTGPSITRAQYQANVAGQQQLFQRKGLQHLFATLNFRPSQECEASMETLRLLANCYKHRPGPEPSDKLLIHLGLPPIPQGQLIVGYMPLPESSAFKEGLAESINLSKDSDYCLIAEKFIELAGLFLEGARRGVRLSVIRASLFEFGA